MRHNAWGLLCLDVRLPVSVTVRPQGGRTRRPDGDADAGDAFDWRSPIRARNPGGRHARRAELVSASRSARSDADGPR
ncbi:hypothetical protein WOLCODRAFT_153875 [Wolfiporia cocos MD-104 SS10]|uniref:Uncharacterized protein n=1 Tax=Wolfiporia cocos (strain MD-104) TaxID=742152 RepID=A0A2H3K132_WOLCO|nr:hypothetical protein WOLCODRAFT_153875 [Wolfiporia cocos MD-104 SS10]